MTDQEPTDEEIARFCVDRIGYCGSSERDVARHFYRMGKEERCKICAYNCDAKIADLERQLAEAKKSQLTVAQPLGGRAVAPPPSNVHSDNSAAADCKHEYIETFDRVEEDEWFEACKKCKKSRDDIEGRCYTCKRPFNEAAEKQPVLTENELTELKHCVDVSVGEGCTDVSDGDKLIEKLREYSIYHQPRKEGKE